MRNTLQGGAIEGNAADDSLMVIRVAAPQLTLGILFSNILLLLRPFQANEVLSDMPAGT
jgi:hypothetical protein